MKKGAHGPAHHLGEDQLLFHAGTKADGEWSRAGARVLACIGLDAELEKAVQKAYDLVDKVKYEGKDLPHRHRSGGMMRAQGQRPESDDVAVLAGSGGVLALLAEPERDAAEDEHDHTEVERVARSARAPSRRSIR